MTRWLAVLGVCVCGVVGVAEADWLYVYNGAPVDPRGPLHLAGWLTVADQLPANQAMTPVVPLDYGFAFVPTRELVTPELGWLWASAGAAVPGPLTPTGNGLSAPGIVVANDQGQPPPSFALATDGAWNVTAWRFFFPVEMPGRPQGDYVLSTSTEDRTSYYGAVADGMASGQAGAVYVPEPGTGVLLGLGALVLGWRRVRRGART